ncbi:hypothetical protein SAMN04487911_10428 [Arenibacter nanhaiticus]|uniref:Secreted protein n=1 Tax=Arenibacter nanhaiticus TaxID=558155 RepID=A0A1M6CRC2_9FLAO|nr:hypothetical protein [Arenibacter nanhaiticus]SHI63557.1 hypothetical protein SAMN04487911_10428 [Arenibacter nanhaiticus]
MKNVFRQIAAFSLALLVLLSTMSFTVDMHFCGKTLVDYSFFDQVDSCGMEMMQPAANEECSVVVDNCCKEENIVVEGQDDLKISFDSLTFQQQAFVIAYSYSFLSLLEGDLKNKVPFGDYSPPLLIRDIHILDETFLI